MGLLSFRLLTLTLAIHAPVVALAVAVTADVVVVPSIYDPFPLVTLEAMILSRPVVGAAVGGIPEQVDDGRTGILVPPRDAEAIASALIRHAVPGGSEDPAGRLTVASWPLVMRRAPSIDSTTATSRRRSARSSGASRQRSSRATDSPRARRSR